MEPERNRTRKEKFLNSVLLRNRSRRTQPVIEPSGVQQLIEASIEQSTSADRVETHHNPTTSVMRLRELHRRIRSREPMELRRRTTWSNQLSPPNLFRNTALIGEIIRPDAESHDNPVQFESTEPILPHPNIPVFALYSDVSTNTDPSFEDLLSASLSDSPASYIPINVLINAFRNRHRRPGSLPVSEDERDIHRINSDDVPQLGRIAPIPSRISNIMRAFRSWEQDMQNQIDSLPKGNITAEHVENKEICPVCLEHFILSEEVKILPCCHKFHCDCISPWLKKRQTCPICRDCVIKTKRSLVTACRFEPYSRHHPHRYVPDTPPPVVEQAQGQL